MHTEEPSLPPGGRAPRHPYARLTVQGRRRTLVVALLVLAVAVVGLAVTAPALMTPLTPVGIVSWQLAGSGAEVAAILAEWGAEGRAAARVNLLVDLAFAPAYGLVIGLVAVRLGVGLGRRRPAAAMADLAAWAALLAAVADLAENTLMLWVLGAGASDVLAVATRTLALVKFALLGVALVLVVGLLVLRWRARTAVEPT